MTSEALPQASAPRLATSEGAAWMFCALGLAMVVALVALRGGDLAAVPVAVMGAGAAVAAALGRVRNRPEVGYPWVLFSLACVAFILGAVLRQVLAGHTLAPLADVATFSGYAATLAAFIGLLRCRQSNDRGVHELIDGAIVLVSVGAAAVVFFTLPTAENVGFSVAGAVQGAYPVVDSVMVFVAILLSWTSARRVTSFWLLGFSVVFILVGDLGYAWIGTRGQTVGSPLLDLPFVVAFTLFGAAALHPSMRQLSSVQQRPVPAWSRGASGLLVPVLVGPPLLSLASDDPADTWVGAVAGASVTVLLLIRAVTAVQANARAQEGLRYQATHDQLTRLVNRPRLLEVVDELLARAAREGDGVDVLFLDLDSFKLVNDTWGHQVGDRVLRLAAQRLLTVTRPEDTVARIGGDEFVIARYVGHGSAATGDQLAGHVVEAFRAPLPGEDSLVTTVSIGLAGSQRDSASRGPASAESMLRDADTAMYRAKAAGRNRCHGLRPVDARLGAAPRRDGAGPALRAGPRRATAALPARRLGADRRGRRGRGPSPLGTPAASAWCPRWTSSRSPRRPDSSSRSASGSCPRRCVRPLAGGSSAPGQALGSSGSPSTSRPASCATRHSSTTSRRSLPGTACLPSCSSWRSPSRR